MSNIELSLFQNNDSVTYSLSKAAVDQFTRTTALELGPNKVRVNCVNPGAIKTEIVIKAGFSMEQYEGVIIEIKFPCCLCNELIKNPNFLVFQLSWENFQNSIFLIKVKLLIPVSYTHLTLPTIYSV